MASTFHAIPTTQVTHTMHPLPHATARQPRRSSRLAMMLRLCLCLAAPPVAAMADTTNATAWRGELEVRQHVGSECGAQPSLPYRLTVFGLMSTEPGDQSPDSSPLWMLWGDMHPIQLRWGPGASTAALLSLSTNQHIGVLQASAVAGNWSATWREEANESGCNFVDAALRMVRVEDATQAASIRRDAEYLAEVYATQRRVVAAMSPDAAREPLAQMLALAGRLPQASAADQSLAWAFMAAGEHALLLGNKETTLGLHGAGTTLYRRLRTPHPEDTALALVAQARAFYRYRDRPQAFALLEEALTILDQAGKQISAAAANVRGLQGVWQLLRGDKEAALQTLTQAASIDMQRNAPPDERVATLLNLGMVLSESNRTAEALAVYQRSLDLLRSATEHPGTKQADMQSLRDILESRIQELKGMQPSKQT
ncbi:tetratricopeptide repeat protein [Candidatus Symbiobacter mobilis]|nr:tetratricopeptide repeat protein [Candidatus Symbiobacter mobilis]